MPGDAGVIGKDIEVLRRDTTGDGDCEYGGAENRGLKRNYACTAASAGTLKDLQRSAGAGSVR